MFLRYIVHWLVEEGGPPPLHAAFDAADAWRTTHGEGVMPADFEKVLYVLKNVARDWSKEFQAERDESYGVLCDLLQTLFKDRLGNEPSPRVLVPGCGLADLEDLSDEDIPVKREEGSTEREEGGVEKNTVLHVPDCCILSTMSVLCLKFLVECNKLVVEIDNDIVNVYNYIRDRYRSKFPELESLVQAPLDYAAVVKRLGMKWR
eukprot:jgi/Picre1/34577/NNA_002045.t1